MGVRPNASSYSSTFVGVPVRGIEHHPLAYVSSRSKWKRGRRYYLCSTPNLLDLTPYHERIA